MKYLNEIYVDAKFHRNLVSRCNNIKMATKCTQEGTLEDLCIAMADEIATLRAGDSFMLNGPWQRRATDGNGASVGFSECDEDGNVIACTMFKPNVDQQHCTMWISYTGTRKAFRTWCDSVSLTYSDDVISERVNRSAILASGKYVPDDGEENMFPAELYWEYVVRMGGQVLHEELGRIIPRLIGKSPFDYGYFTPSHSRPGAQTMCTGWHVIDKPCDGLSSDDWSLLKDYFNDTRVIADTILYANDARITATLAYFESASLARINLTKATTIFNTSE